MRPPVRQAAVLAGGLGTRLGHHTAGMPKPMVTVGDRPFLAWILRELCRFGIEDVVLLTGHLSEVIEAAVPGLLDRLPRPMRLTCVREPFPAGTGGALVHARAHLQPHFLLCNGDSWLDCNLMHLLTAAAGDDDDVRCRLLLHPVPDAGRFGTVVLDGQRVTAFREKDGAASGPGMINAGVYVMDRRMLDRLPDACSLERDVLPTMVAAGAVRGSVMPGWFIDIGIPDELARAQAEVPARLLRRALFLDRDGVINHDHGWVGTRERFAFIHGAVEAIRAATDAGWHVFVVTNQSGIARGFYDEAQFAELTAWMIGQIRAAGGTVDDVRHCPFHPDAAVPAYRQTSEWRKPAPGMILDVLRRWEVDPRRCLLIGDQSSDLEAAQAAGVAGHLFPGGDLRAFAAPLMV